MGEIVPTLVTRFRVVSLRFEPWVEFFATDKSVMVNTVEIPAGAHAVYTEKDGAIGCTLSYTIGGVDGFFHDAVQEALDRAESLGYVTVVDCPPKVAEDL
jgi:hypothetical protein